MLFHGAAAAAMIGQVLVSTIGVCAGLCVPLLLQQSERCQRFIFKPLSKLP
jgi:hypothetical protein